MTNEGLLQELRRMHKTLDKIIAELTGTAQPPKSKLDIIKECVETGTWRNVRLSKNKRKPRKQK